MDEEFISRVIAALYYTRRLWTCIT